MKAWADWLNLTHEDDKEVANLIAKCAAFAVAFKRAERPRWLALLGNTGVGKTHCAKRLWDYMKVRVDWDDCEFVHSFVYWPSFVDKLRSGEAYVEFQDICRWPALVIDDIGAERDNSGFATDKLNTLLGCRHSKWTILTSNLTLRHFGEIEPRIADRIIRMPNIYVEVKAKSYSLREKV